MSFELLVTIFAIVFGVISIFSSIFAFVLSRRLLQFDELFELFTHDIETNTGYLQKLQNTPLLSNAPEVVQMHKNMKIMADRLNEYSIQMKELTNRDS